MLLRLAVLLLLLVAARVGVVPFLAAKCHEVERRPDRFGSRVAPRCQLIVREGGPALSRCPVLRRWIYAIAFGVR